MTASPILDVRRLRSWIGSEETASDEITVDLVRKFNATFDRKTPRPATGDIAPALIHYCLAQPAVTPDLLGEDGHPGTGGFLPSLPLPRRMWGAGSLIFNGDLRIGDTVRRVSRVADIAVKEGRTGVLCMVTVEHRLDVQGVPKVEERQVIVYREAASAEDAANPATEKPAPAGAWTKPIDICTTLLFRYSALTFNGHRIHYDRAYATGAESYPGLVVHGPLQATLLLNYAAEIRGRTPSRFAFRGQSPLFDDDRASLHAQDAEGWLKLWTARHNGPVAMSAEAHWS